MVYSEREVFKMAARAFVTYQRKFVSYWAGNTVSMTPNLTQFLSHEIKIAKVCGGKTLQFLPMTVACDLLQKWDARVASKSQSKQSRKFLALSNRFEV